MSLQRTYTMTLGFVLIFLGLQLIVVDSVLLTPRITNFLFEHDSQGINQQSSSYASEQANSPYRQVGFMARASQVNNRQSDLRRRRVKPPKWLCWPVLFCGTVVLLHGATMTKQ